MSTVDSNRVLLTGENSVIRLSTDDSDNFTTNATFWHLVARISRLDAMISVPLGPHAMRT